ncbi:nicotinic acid mononucleotide adenyltransferase [Salegentibacter sp. F188]|uniref:Nicotinic acid mononucleotide adenyltransferase n=1 Tax=Autumnicola patrickiae TaxID=3075591 RepID=A0ABU3E4H4_9FLAO|nr:nicotinic acid mononucleotide adenyltransferase [Salegentibacter sp. F188]MDT0690891.1 nicotinic acid mononucleotide adenyltransferase [Salegentibacter sp. F188]
MKKIKQMMLIGALVVSSAVMAQEKEPVFEQQGDLIKGTFYYEDGNIRQEGTYKDGELHGEWVSYNKEGEKTTIGQYERGQKTGKWFFWTEDNLTEVDYKDSRISSVNSWKSESGLVSRD